MHRQFDCALQEGEEDEEEKEEEEEKKRGEGMCDNKVWVKDLSSGLGFSTG